MKSTSRLGSNRKRVNPTAVWGVRWLKQWMSRRAVFELRQNPRWRGLWSCCGLRTGRRLMCGGLHGGSRW
ncbi:hypothetical protein HanIR_Chr09g0398941 [Helianthus annuus]|nr:hypothetical protein HanIR_Chr09g0398941 [Helianthus annuus]